MQLASSAASTQETHEPHFDYARIDLFTEHFKNREKALINLGKSLVSRSHIIAEWCGNPTSPRKVSISV